MTTRSRVASLERSKRHAPGGAVTSSREMIALLLSDPESAAMTGRCADLLSMHEATHDEASDTMSDAERTNMDDAFAALMSRAEMLVRQRGRMTIGEGMAA